MYDVLKPSPDDDDTINYSPLLDSRHNSSPSIQPSLTVYHAIYYTKVPDSQKQYFEDIWLKDILASHKLWKGFRHRSVHLITHKNNFAEYLIILAFEDYETFREWTTSKTREYHINKLQPRGIVSKRVNLYGGMSVSAETTIQGDIEAPKVLSQPTRVSLHECMTDIPRPLPPPKWKLCIVIYIGVCLSSMGIVFSGLPDHMLSIGLPVGFVILVTLCLSVPMLSYSFFPLLFSVPFVDAWVRKPRSVPPDEMSPLHSLLDQGLMMFSSHLRPTVSREVSGVISKIEGRLTGLRRINHDLSCEIVSLRRRIRNLERCSGDNAVVESYNEVQNMDHTYECGVQTGDTKDTGSAAGVVDVLHDRIREKAQETLAGDSLGTESTAYPMSGSIDEEDFGAPLTMAVTHWVKWEHHLDFEKWTAEMTDEMSRHEGFLGLTTIIPKHDDDPYVNSFAFDTYDHLMCFITSDRRKRIIKKLEPLLQATCAAEVNEERVINSAFAELFVSTGDCAAPRPPPIWKTVILIIIPLHIIVWQIGYNLVPILIVGAGLSPIVARIVSTVVTVTTNTYIGVPLMHSQFGDWLTCDEFRSKRSTTFEFLDVGLSRTMQVIVLIIFSTLVLLGGIYYRTT